MRKIKTWRNPFDTGITPCSRKEIEIKEGVTVLVGCNGSGKTTLIQNICECLRKDKIPYIHYDNLTDSEYSIGSLLNGNDIEQGAYLFSASEGESIAYRLGLMAERIIKFIQTGEDETRYSKFASIFRDRNAKENEILSNERWLLYDATDSGLSIDNVIELKEVFKALLHVAEQNGVVLYIVISANEYELVNGSECFDVNSCKYMQFDNYEDYKKFILNSAAKKAKREEKARQWREKRKEREEKERKK